MRFGRKTWRSKIFWKIGPPYCHLPRRFLRRSFSAQAALLVSSSGACRVISVSSLRSRSTVNGRQLGASDIGRHLAGPTSLARYSNQAPPIGRRFGRANSRTVRGRHLSSVAYAQDSGLRAALRACGTQLSLLSILPPLQGRPVGLCNCRLSGQPRHCSSDLVIAIQLLESSCACAETSKWQ